MTRDETIKAAEELAKRLEQSDKWEDTTIIRSLIVLVPGEGMVIVPKEPTKEMMAAGVNLKRYDSMACYVGVNDIYKAMLKAAKEE